jgi:hypothetical protein
VKRFVSLQFLNLRHSVGLLGRVISPSQGQGRYLTQIQTDIHASNGIRTHDLSFRVSEDSSCFRPRGHCDPQVDKRLVILSALSNQLFRLSNDTELRVCLLKKRVFLDYFNDSRLRFHNDVRAFRSSRHQLIISTTYHCYCLISLAGIAQSV